MSHKKITVPLANAGDESLCAMLLTAQFFPDFWEPRQRLLKSSL